LPLAHGICQDAPRVARRPAGKTNESSLAHYRQGEAYLQQNNYQSAANEFREALNGDLEPAWTKVLSHIQLARIFDLTGQPERAVNEYRQATRTIIDGTAAEPIRRTEPEYTDEARLAELEGTVVLSGVINESGLAENIEVATPLGLGLDENAIAAVKQWQFEPHLTPPFRRQANIYVSFRLPSKRSLWHLIGVHFDPPGGVSRPVFTSALYPIGAGIGLEAREEGSVLVAIGRMATAMLYFDIDEHGVPVGLQTLNASERMWGAEAAALIGQWRFTPAARNGIPVASRCRVELVWGEKELTTDLERQLHDVLAVR
jgi:TonB family protein